ncbi:hypothetical protein BO85DRAFT_306859 [Aspergillus piperis CBS 112811]|uniref:Uncharacterized protein n=1 Tax=Aspergillus piperis CBS 112811 TaxID=1448313 RepID=A0A8G1VLH8_9EURO|nr:hypothetical protein BO85DRAFT_306859 [Aspergillus piperis CBS 112811]RAH57606.1 hypothetical protein BO85DRAFT_306859 [Aspergillus piperis CBS 112811]
MVPISDANLSHRTSIQHINWDLIIYAVVSYIHVRFLFVCFIQQARCLFIPIF